MTITVESAIQALSVEYLCQIKLAPFGASLWVENLRNLAISSCISFNYYPDKALLFFFMDKDRNGDNSWMFISVCFHNNLENDIHVTWMYFVDIKIRDTFVYKHILTLDAGTQCV